jgi:hypothetical protein
VTSALHRVARRGFLVATWAAPTSTGAGPLAGPLDAVGGPVLDVHPLHGRPADVAALVRCAVDPAPAPLPEVVRMLTGHRRPGNTGELIREVRAAAIAAGDEPIARPSRCVRGGTSSRSNTPGPR